MGHKDRLTASCPHFRARSDYRGCHLIECAMGAKAFGGVWERDQYYRTICCECGRGCELLDIDKRRGPKE